MGKAKFILKEPKSKEETLVYLVYNYNYKRFKFSTSEKILPKFWSAKNQRAKETKQFPQYPEFNNRLNIIENGINNAFRRVLNDGVQPNNEILKKELLFELSDNVIKPKQITFLEFTDDYIKECEKTKRDSTVRGYKVTLKYLKLYRDKYDKGLDFDSITIEFYNKFLVLLTDNNLSTNTIGKHIKTLKIILNEATERGYNSNLEFKKKKFKATKEESEAIYLTLDELKKVENIDLKEDLTLDKVRDLFLVGCYTGLRFSDFIKIKPENIIKDNSVLQMRTQKTGERVYIPLHKVVKDILVKYEYNLPKAFTNQYMNKFLKKVVEKAGLDELMETTITKGGEVVKSTVARYDMVSTHTARRSFATNLYLADVPTISIMKITGHRTEKSFLQYIKVTQEQNADKLLNHPFFSTK